MRHIRLSRDLPDAQRAEGEVREAGTPPKHEPDQSGCFSAGIPVGFSG